MKSIILSALLVIATVTLSGCAGMVQSIKEHNERVAARQAEQQQAAPNQAAPNQAPVGADMADAGRQQSNKKHAPYKGNVRVALFTTFRGKLWQKGMKGRAADGLREDLAAHAQFELVPEERMQKLGKLGTPDMDSAAWAGKVRNEFGKRGPQVLLHVTLTCEEAIGKNKSTGKIEKYPRFTAQTDYRHVKRNATATYSKDGHVFANGNVMNAVITDFHERALTEIMPAK